MFVSTDILSGGSRSSTPNTLQRQLLTPQVGQLDSTLLNDLEVEARELATSIDNLTENLCGILHSVRRIMVILIHCVIIFILYRYHR